MITHGSEPEEYKRLLWLLAINEAMLNDLEEQYSSGTDAPPQKSISSQHLSASEAEVPQSMIAEYKVMLATYNSRLIEEISQYKRVKSVPHLLGAATQEKASEPKTTKGTARGSKKAGKRDAG